MLGLVLALAVAAGERESVDVTIHQPDAPVKCSALDAYYFGCRLARSAAAKRQQEEREHVGKLIADGKCEEARRVALEAADFYAAEKVKALCTPAP